jgi:hypothetical protein
MSTFDAVTDAVELMRVWSDEGAVAAQDRVSEITGGRREDLLVGLVNLLGSALCLRETERGVPPAKTLEALMSHRWN